MIAAGIRGVPVGHTNGQQMVAYLHEPIAGLTAESSGRALDSAGSGSPFYEVLCEEQSRLYSRLFRS
jgi:urease accessory protein